jgi:hypothetical protein
MWQQYIANYQEITQAIRNESPAFSPSIALLVYEFASSSAKS